MDKSQSNYSTWKKADQKKKERKKGNRERERERDEYMLCDSIYLKFSKCGLEGGKADHDFLRMEWGGGCGRDRWQRTPGSLEDSEYVHYLEWGAHLWKLAALNIYCLL